MISYVLAAPNFAGGRTWKVRLQPVRAGASSTHPCSLDTPLHQRARGRSGDRDSLAGRRDRVRRIRSHVPADRHGAAISVSAQLGSGRHRPDPATLSLLSTAVMGPSSRSDSRDRSAASLSELVRPERSAAAGRAPTARARPEPATTRQAGPHPLPGRDVVDGARRVRRRSGGRAARQEPARQGYRVDLRRRTARRCLGSSGSASRPLRSAPPGDPLASSQLIS